MSRILREVKRFWKNEEGPTAVEYAVMLALIILVCYTAISTFGESTNSMFKRPVEKGAFGK
jgi:pilus assembly protein Flp/PilA